MGTYLALNIIFTIIVVAAVLLSKLHRQKVEIRSYITTLFIVLFITALFDSRIIDHHIVAYDLSKILGVYIGSAPIEDFFYAVVAALCIPVLWKKLDARYASRRIIKSE